MAADIPSTMRAIALPEFCNPSEYGLATIPTPQITRPDEILVRVKAASVNPIDVKLAGSLGKLMSKDTKFPYTIGYDLSGIIVAIGTGVTDLQVGDEVYSRIPSAYHGSLAQYCLSTSTSTCLKPRNLSFTEAAALPLAGQTALQALDKGAAHLPGGLEGKTVLIPAGLSGTGSFAVQLAKNCFGAGKVITTLSTGKIGKVGELLGEGAPDVCVDYTKGKGEVVKEVGKGSVDFMFDTQGYTISALSVMRHGGQIVSISTVPNGTEFRKKNEGMPAWLVWVMDLADWGLKWWTGLGGVGYEYLVMQGKREDLERLKGWVEEGKVKPVVGSVVKMEDIRGVREGCQRILEGKGGVGKFVVEVE